MKRIVHLLASIILVIVSIIPFLRTSTVHASYQASSTSINPIISTDNKTNTETEEEIEDRVRNAGLSYLKPWNATTKIYPALEEEISHLNPSDNITVIVILEMKPDTVAAIDTATAPEQQAQKEITEEIQRRGKAAFEEFKKEFGGKAEALYYAKDPAAQNRLKLLEQEHGIDKESIKPMVEQLKTLNEYRNRKVSAVLKPVMWDFQVRR